jgi:glutaminyl-tRNA synthetase
MCIRDRVQQGLVSGWDDPRMPTISGMRRRGYSPAAIRDFCARIGVAKINSTIALETLEHCVREDLNLTSKRYMGVLDPILMRIENYDGEEEMEVINNPENPTAGTRMVPFSNEIYIERQDFMVEPLPKFYRLSPGREVRLRNAFLVTCSDVIKEDDQPVEVICRVDPESKGGNAPDGRKIKSTLHWVSAKHAADAEIRLYDKLFTVEDPLSQMEDFTQFINPESLKVIKGCKVEPTIRDLPHYARFQFERQGYFCIDPDTQGDRLIINRTIPLRDTWAKIVRKVK